MTKAALFEVKLRDEYGTVHPSALAAIFRGRLLHGEDWEASEVGGDYVDNLSVVGGTYTIMYYSSQAAFDDGYPSRPLRVSEDGELTEVFAVDVAYPPILGLIESGLSKEEKRDGIVKADLERRFL